MKTLTLGILTVVLAFAGAVQAFPTLQGPTGGFQVPTVAVQEGVAIAIDRGENETARVPNLRLEAGLYPGLEAGGGYEKFEADYGDVTSAITQYQINGKYVLPIELLGAQLAIGAAYHQTEFDNDNVNGDATAGSRTANTVIGGGAIDNLKNWSAYLAGTLAVRENTDVTLLALYDDVKLQAAGGGEFKSQKLVPAIAVEQRFDNGSAIGAEYFVNVSPYSSLAFMKVTSLDANDLALDFGNIYARFPLNNAVTARIAFNGINQHTGFTAGLAYAFGAGE